MKGRAWVLASALASVSVGAVGASLAITAGSCTSTTTVVTPSGVCEDITQSKPDLFSPPDGACVVPAADGSVPVIVNVNGTFAFRPPGNSCAYVCNCGYLEVYVDGVLNNTSGSAVIDANLATLGPALYGTHTITVQLVWDLNDGGGEDLFDAGTVSDAGADGGPSGLLTASVTVTVAASCGDGGPSGDAGSGDAGSADGGSGDAGSSDAGSGDAGSGDAGSADAGSDDAGSDDAGSSDAGSSDAGSDDAGSDDAGPGDAGDGGDGG